ncbi:MAG: histidine phosphatase family protein [Nitrospirae bacterium]|nr:histidine phosphatase family protein [Nitrospirota bacterium]
MATTVFLIRHGKTVGWKEKRYKGQSDVPLADEGIGQVEHAAWFVRRYLTEIAGCAATGGLSLYDTRTVPTPAVVESDKEASTEDASKNVPTIETRATQANLYLDRIYCSDLSRAVKTAEILGRHFGMAPVPLSELRERHFGRWEGMSFDEIREAYPGEFAGWAKDPFNFSPVGGESTADVHERGMAILNKLLKVHKDEKIAIVAHGGINRVVLCDVIGAPLRNLFRLEQDFACVNVIEFHENFPVVKVLNYT